ncbi:GDP-mannose mannosyl hydrolase [Marinicellulosiphila megalodicopiae]|uniref:GDP-mannose mannosyl hydrolase n=1 Tax=Marinicellulosiphila megalodicopiae TaxID=2724896 RepID=UPI003BAF96B9
MLEKQLFKSIIKHTPLVSIDLIIKNSNGEILLGKRNNKPAQGFWFVPGGRILKNETMAAAFTRLVEVELGVKNKQIQDSQLIDVYEHFYDDNTFQETAFQKTAFQGQEAEDDFSTHYVVIGRRIELNINLADLPVDQHNQYQWFSEQQLLASDQVHLHTKWYFHSPNN